MNQPSNPMAQLRRRLSKAGINPKYLKEKILPEWWDDQIARTPAGLAEVHGLLYSRAGIDLESLRDSDAPIRYTRPSVKHRKPKSIDASDLVLSETLASRAARVAARGLATPFGGFHKTPADIRDALKSRGQQTPNLESLLEYSWQVGIPVIHMGTFPSGARKMEGLVTEAGGRPAVVISKNMNSPAWQVFILAHELGHVFHGHLDRTGMLADYNLNGISEDSEEKEADLFALELLTGSPGMTFTSPYLLKAQVLASEARRLGERLNIDPGVVVLNYAKVKEGVWPLANSALKHLEIGDSAIELIHRRMISGLDRDLLGDESYAWLLSITGASRYA